MVETNMVNKELRRKQEDKDSQVLVLENHGRYKSRGSAEYSCQSKSRSHSRQCKVVVYNICRKIGHIKRFSKELWKDGFGHKREEVNISATNSDKDTVASFHINPNKGSFTTYTVSKFGFVLMGNHQSNNIRLRRYNSRDKCRIHNNPERCSPCSDDKDASHIHKSIGQQLLPQPF